MRETIELATTVRETLVDITAKVADVVRRSGIGNGIINVYAQGATAAIMIQENWDESVQMDVINLLRQQTPKGVWLHDAQDGNGDAHLKAGLVGPSETTPLIDGKPGCRYGRTSSSVNSMVHVRTGGWLLPCCLTVD